MKNALFLIVSLSALAALSGCSHADRKIASPWDRGGPQPAPTIVPTGIPDYGHTPPIGQRPGGPPPGHRLLAPELLGTTTLSWRRYEDSGYIEVDGRCPSRDHLPVQGLQLRVTSTTGVSINSLFVELENRERTSIIVNERFDYRPGWNDLRGGL